MSEEMRPGAKPTEHEEPQDEVEAHGGHHGNKFGANIEGDTEETGGDDDFEAHRHIKHA
ncbi:MAG TPA: hypothetical protein VFA56_01930 [Gaiellaceae bacterium]|nr:hypothetical protein [Gaiellaceae bacterium]